ncbi:hypothetical protein F2P81_017455 [Scophthalmus maximus]|uniref:Uncharacterized protein n=1 Tax=Scophthalmus maximus TaxID=52904 RepID=A0A6A4SIC9_SCOMX|nr:hypothetical protein F2P81_017455 [Scophthalmus maximus]
MKSKKRRERSGNGIKPQTPGRSPRKAQSAVRHKHDFIASRPPSIRLASSVFFLCFCVAMGNPPDARAGNQCEACGSCGGPSPRPQLITPPLHSELKCMSNFPGTHSDNIRNDSIPVV